MLQDTADSGTFRGTELVQRGTQWVWELTEAQAGSASWYRRVADVRGVANQFPTAVPCPHDTDWLNPHNEMSWVRPDCTPGKSRT